MSAIGDLEFTLDVRSGQDFDLEIYDSQAPDGFLGGSYGGAGSDETVRITMSYSGPYYALVYTYGSSSGDYTISNESIEPKPDLTPYQPSGWSDKLIVSDVSGTNTDGTLYANQVAYIDYSALNDGDADTGTGFYVELWDDTTGEDTVLLLWARIIIMDRGILSGLLPHPATIGFE